MKRFFVLLCLVLVLVPLNALGADALKIGILFPFSGPLAMVGGDYWEAWDVISEMMNQKGGVLGRKVVGVKADAVDPKTAMSEAERLITVEKVNIIIGTYSSPRAMVASEVAEKYKKIYFETGAAADDLTSRGLKSFFRFQVKGSTYGSVGSTYAAKVLAPAMGIGVKDLKVVVCYEDSIWGSTINKAFNDQAKIEGFKISESIGYNYKAVDFSAMITKFKSIQPDIVLASNYPNDFMIMWRQMKQMDFNMKAYVGTGTLIHDSLAESLGNDVNYVFDVQGMGLQNFNMQTISNETKSFLSEIQSIYKKKYGKEMAEIIYGPAYIMWLVLKQIIPMAGSDDPEAVRAATLKLNIPLKDTLLGYGVKFAGPDSPEAGQNVLANPGIMQWQNKKLWTVYPPELATAKMLPIMPKWAERK